MSESKLLKGIIIGAVSGALISLLDRKTREHTIKCLGKAKDTIVYYVKNRDELEQLISEQVENVQQLYEKTTENVSVIVDKIDEIKELPETVQTIVENTKLKMSPDQSNEG